MSQGHIQTFLLHSVWMSPELSRKFFRLETTITDFLCYFETVLTPPVTASLYRSLVSMSKTLETTQIPDCNTLHFLSSVSHVLVIKVKQRLSTKRDGKVIKLGDLYQCLLLHTSQLLEPAAFSW